MSETVEALEWQIRRGVTRLRFTPALPAAQLEQSIAGSVAVRA